MTTFKQNICGYSVYSLQFYLLFPLVKIGQQLQLPQILNYIIALSLPGFLLVKFISFASKRNYLTLVKHTPIPDHPHDINATIKVILQSTLLGTILTIGLSFIDFKLQSHFVPLGLYMVILSFFHLSEFFVTSITNPSTLSPSSFLIDHSAAYLLATAISLLEFVIEIYLFPGFKRFNVISFIGLLLSVCGELVRKTAMFTAGTNFTHAISFEKHPQHKLVTHGIYSILRHPSYAGWFYWALGTQIILLNPLCLIGFTYVSYEFFENRIDGEESILLDFFGEDYEKYRKKTGLWMPIKLKQK